MYRRPHRRSRLCPVTVALGLLGLCFSLASPADEPVTVRHMPSDTSFDRRDDYALALLQLALEKTTEDHGPARLEAAPFRVSQARAERLIRDGDYLDVLWAMTSRDREAVLLPVRIPLMRGLMGARVLVVTKDRRGRMAEVESLMALRGYPLAQGHDWPDSAILRANALHVETSSDFHSLFRMLARGRVAAVPRSITEIWAEQDLHERFQLTVEPDLLLLYRAPNYFFVSPERPDLQQRISMGLERAIADGSFERLFQTHPATAPALALLATENLRIIRLSNPDLTGETPLEREELWHQPLFEGHPTSPTRDDQSPAR
ncbi:transporter substrate-binding domain-containing protein [Methylonatrum kenyense]|uniref:substrate-binding periplasmic protein n=1 Tax=Methylonatrum kenyense TaxID=455253 RepID=UPI0020BDC577|nr:transporter substrate-binding domain-containing protein [Methylonatrum kenyense]MCK8515612.1 transporter substrate-binding domain-containing protein [Methylonatrum kenyense]